MNAPARMPAGTDVRAIDIGDARAAARWDAFVRERAEGTPFHLTLWARAIGRAFGHRAHYLAVERGGALTGVLPLIHVRSPVFGGALVSNAFAVYGGPIADTPGDHRALDEAAWALARRLGLKSLEYRSRTRTRPDWPAKSETYATFRRPLAPDDDANLKAIPRKQRADVRKAIDSELTVEVGRGARDLARHFEVYATSVRNLGTPVFAPALFRETVAAFGADADVLTVMHAGRPVASVLSLYHGGEVLPYWGGGTAEAVPTRANLLMYWALMRHAAARGCTGFDFGRSKFGTGPFAFKKNWGFEPAPLHYEYRLADGAAMPDLNPNNPKFAAMTRLWAKLPLWLANRAGPLVSRGLG